MRIACLHTVDSNIAVFEAAASGLPGVTLTHHVRADLLKRAEAAGQLTDEIRDEVLARLLALNATRHAEEVAAGTAPGMKAGKKPSENRPKRDDELI